MTVSAGQRFYDGERRWPCGYPWRAGRSGECGEGLPEAPLRQREQHDATARAEKSVIEGARDFLPPDGWNAEGSDCIVDHGERGTARSK